MKRVGTNHLGYPEIRNFQGLPLKNYEVVKEFNLFHIPAKLMFKLLGRTSYLFHNLHFKLFSSKGDLHHLFNGVSLNRSPWVSTFETFVPRLRTGEALWNNHRGMFNKWAIKRLASESCKQLMAISENARDIQMQILSKHYPEYKEAIEKKLIVLPPQQELLIHTIGEKSYAGRLTCVLVGPDFFNKGGLETLRVFDALLQEGKELELHIVSPLRYGDEHTRSTIDDQREAQTIIERHPNHIFRQDRLPNKDLLELFKRSHLHIRASYVDTYGFSVLEAQACGTPVISTNIRAMGTINSDRWGFLIDVPKDEFGKALIGSPGERQVVSRAIEDQLQKHLKDMLSQPDQIRLKAELCLKRIKEEHDPDMLASRLEEIYTKALSS